MRKNPIAAAWLLSALSTACAAHQAPPPRVISTAWRTIEALGPGTELGVRLEDGVVHYGRLHDVSAEGVSRGLPAQVMIAYTGQPTPVELTTSAEHGQLSVALPDAPCQVAISFKEIKN